MASTKAESKQGTEQLVAESIATCRELSVTHRSADGWRVYKGSFLSGTKESNQILVGVRHEGGSSTVNLPDPGDPLGITFRLNHKKCIFATELIDVRHVDGEVCFSIRWPQQLQQLQRRSYQRVNPPRGHVIAVRFWQEQHEQSSAERVVRHGQLEDLSAGGMRIRVANPSDMEIGETYRCVFTPHHGAPPILCDAVLRHREACDNGRAALGLHFIGLDTTAQGIRLLGRLARIVSQFRRLQPR